MAQNSPRAERPRARPERGFEPARDRAAPAGGEPESRPNVATAATEFPSFLYKAIGGFALWFALAIWALMGSGRSAYLMTIAIAFVGGTYGLQWLLRRVWRGTHPAAQAAQDAASFADWAAGDMDVQSGRMRGREAAVEVLLPFAAAAVAMTGFLLVVIVSG